MNNLLLVKSSVKTVAVAFDEAPVIVSPLVNFPKPVSSKSILLPWSNCVLSVSKREASNTKLFYCAVSVSNLIPSVVSILVTANSADSINVK